MQVIVVLSDGDHSADEDPLEELQVLKSRGVVIFCVGVGVWLRPSAMRFMASKDNYYAMDREWKHLLESRPTTLKPGKCDWAGTDIERKPNLPNLPSPPMFSTVMLTRTGHARTRTRTRTKPTRTRTRTRLARTRTRT